MRTFSSSSSRMAWFVWLTASVFYTYQYVLRVMPNVFLEDILRRFSMDAAVFGQFSGIYYLGYALMHIPLGILLDRHGPRRVMSSCILLTVLGLCPLLFATHWVYSILGRFLMGLGSSAAILGVFKVIRMTFPEARFPRMLSWSVTIGLLGAVYGGGPLHSLRTLFGYQTVVGALAVVGVLLAVATFCLLPDPPQVSQDSVLNPLKEVFGNRKVLFTCVLAGLMVGPLEGFADVWGAVFFKQVYGFDSSLAARLPSLLFVGMCFGSPVLSFLAERIGSYLLTILGAGLVMTVGFAGFLAFPLPLSWLTVDLGLIGICCAYQIFAIYTIGTYVRPAIAGLATAVANMIIMTFGYIFHAILGVVVKAMGGPSFSHALVTGLSVIPLALGLALTGFFWIWLQSVRKPKEEKPLPVPTEPFSF